MSLIQSTAPELEALPGMGAAHSLQGHAARLAAMRHTGRMLRERFADEPTVVSVRTFPRYSLTYPVRYGFWGMAMVPMPFTVIRNRTLLIQFLQNGRLRTLLFNPSDVSAVADAPFVARQFKRSAGLARLTLHSEGPLEPMLEKAGVPPEAIDYVAFDHFHFQDLCNLLHEGKGCPARFPNARLIARRQEWLQWDDLHPLHQAFAVPGAKDGVDEARVILVDDDLRLGDGVMLVHTPGHTEGHQTLFFKTDTGVWGVSENGISADNWTPSASRIRGVPGRLTLHGLEVLPNMNTPESTAEQYFSMVLEKNVVDPAQDDPDFLQMFPSFEVSPSAFTPGMTPYTHKQVNFGELVRRVATPAAPDFPGTALPAMH